MKDINEFRFSGVVEDFKRIQTRTGTPMVSFVVLCGREKIRAVGFRSVAEATDLQRGDLVEARGHLQSNQWTDREGNRRDGWQCIAHEITLADDNKQEPDLPAKMRTGSKPEPRQTDLFPEQRPDPGERFAYQGGPF